MKPIFAVKGWVVGLAPGTYMVEGVLQTYTKEWSGPLSVDWFAYPLSVDSDVSGVAVFRTRSEARKAFAVGHPKGTPYHNAGRTRKVTVEIREVHS